MQLKESVQSAKSDVLRQELFSCLPCLSVVLQTNSPWQDVKRR